MRLRIITVLLLGLLLAGCCGTMTANNAPAWDADPDSLAAELAANRYERESNTALPGGWTHGERVAFFLRALKDVESRQITIDYAKGASK